MTVEYFKPMLDVGSPRVLNCNVLTKRILAKDPAARTFFRCKQLNHLVLIKDTVSGDSLRTAKSAIGTKLYFPFNESNVYEGGRTIFAHDKHLEAALIETFGQSGLPKDALAEDLRVLAVLDSLPTLDPFLLKDVFLNRGIEMNEAYFEIGPDIWNQIESFILQRFEPVVKAAYPDASKSDEKARALIEKIWEARDLEALGPLVEAFRLPRSEALEIFSAWKGVNFYAFQAEQSKPLQLEMFKWLKELQLPTVAISAVERKEIKAEIEDVKTQFRNEWQVVDTILRSYQDGYDKMFTLKTSTAEFVAFLKNSSKIYWDLGNSLGKTGQAVYCWDLMSKRFPGRKVGWEPLREMIALLTKIFKTDQKPTTAVAWQ